MNEVARLLHAEGKTVEVLGENGIPVELTDGVGDSADHWFGEASEGILTVNYFMKACWGFCWGWWSYRVDSAPSPIPGLPGTPGFGTGGKTPNMLMPGWKDSRRPPPEKWPWDEYSETEF